MVAGLCKLLRIAVVSPPYRFNRILQYSTLLSPTPRQKWSFFSDGYEGGSSVYEHALKFQRPSTIKYRHELNNSVSLIGRVSGPLTRVKSQRDVLGVYTVLRVKDTSRPGRDFKILLMMWCHIAEKCLNHLKENDLIYVNGHLGSYAKGVGMSYQVSVKEINYVTPIIGQKVLGEAHNSHLQEEDYADWCRSRLHLWQVFFANPYEWTDLRKKKTNPKQPDFKNKSTGEALWLSPRDPSWLREQLQKLDYAMADQSPEEGQKKCPAGHFL